MATPVQIERGTCFAFFAYDIGLAIDLDEAQRRIAAGMQRGSIQHKRRAPYYFEYQPPPLRVTQTVEPLTLAGQRTDSTVEAVLFDFGVVSVVYSIPLHGPLSDLLLLSDDLYHNPQLLEQSRRVVESLLASIKPAVSKPLISDLVEDYAIHQIETLGGEADLGRLIADHRLLLAQILRAERTPLSPQEIDDALACQISFGPDDRTIIDWNAAVLFDRDANDVRAVLEFANVELLEARYLDDRLDAAMAEAYEVLFKRRRRRRVALEAKVADLWRIAELQVDSALLYEGVNNALKLLGDQYLARVHRLVSQRFHLPEWDASILRKLQTIESIYQKISDRQASRRMETLEWIIILLIAIEILLPFVRGGLGK